jgi:hypothetical protein
MSSTRHNRRNVLRSRIWAYKSLHPCECGESDPIVLTFDHNDGADKVDAVSNMVNKMVVDGHSWHNILAEIKKCKVRCFNCHMKRTAQQHSWYKWQIETQVIKQAEELTRCDCKSCGGGSYQNGLLTPGPKPGALPG